MKEESKEVK